MKRLFNEDSAAPYEGNVKHVDLLMVDAFQRVWDEVVLADDICPRDVELLCHQTLSTLFAENILRRAMAKKRIECQGKCKKHRGTIRSSAGGTNGRMT
jgi:hypothetical protein